MSSDANYAASQTDADRHKDDDQCFRKNTTLTATVHSLTPGFYPRDPASSTDCFRRLLKTYLFARYQCIQRISGSQRLRALYKSTHSLTHSQSLTVERLQKNSRAYRWNTEHLLQYFGAFEYESSTEKTTLCAASYAGYQRDAARICCFQRSQHDPKKIQDI